RLDRLLRRLPDAAGLRPVFPRTRQDRAEAAVARRRQGRLPLSAGARVRELPQGAEDRPPLARYRGRPHVDERPPLPGRNAPALLPMIPSFKTAAAFVLLSVSAAHAQSPD